MFGDSGAKEEVFMLRAETKALRSTIETLQTELVASRQQVLDMTNAMISRTAPQVYQDMRLDQFAETELKDVDPNIALKHKVYSEYFSAMEQDTFSDADEMHRVLNRDLGVAATEGMHTSQVSLHGDEES